MSARKSHPDKWVHPGRGALRRTGRASYLDKAGWLGEFFSKKPSAHGKPGVWFGFGGDVSRSRVCWKALQSPDVLRLGFQPAPALSVLGTFAEVEAFTHRALGTRE